MSPAAREAFLLGAGAGAPARGPFAHLPPAEREATWAMIRALSPAARQAFRQRMEALDPAARDGFRRDVLARDAGQRETFLLHPDR